MKEKLLAAATEDTMQSKDYPISTQDAYVHGVSRYLANIWHDAKEEPEPGREIIIKTAKGTKVHPDTTKSLMAWDYFMRITRETQWTFTDDLTPQRFEHL